MTDSVLDGLDRQLWWTLALVASTAVLLGRRGFVHYAEQGKTASEVFALRANSLPYVTLWIIIAIGAVILAFFHETAEGIGVAGVVLGEFIAVCLWRDYFGNSDFVTQYVKENKKRLTYLLTHGLGMNATEFEEFCRTVEGEVVEFWRKKLKNKKWSDLSEEELGKMLFSSGIESGKVMTRALWEGVLFDVAAFMREWLNGVDRVKVPLRVIGAMHDGGDADAQALFCVGIILANETRELRRTREADSVRQSGRQFSAARIARRKTAAEGILHWPNCLSQVNKIDIKNITWNTEGLSVLDRGNKRPCPEDRIPISVMYSLTEIIKAGYLRVSPEKTISADVTFKYSNMVFKKDEWNQLRTIERKPFRYITSATWMSGDPAFMVEQREVTGRAAELDGSGYLEGVLNLKVDVDVTEEESTWLQQADIHQSEAGIWGSSKDFIQPKRVCVLNLPVFWMIQMTWAIFGLLVSMRKCMLKIRTRPARLQAPNAISQTATKVKETIEALLRNVTIRDPDCTLHNKEAMDIRTKYQSQRDSNASATESAVDEGPSDRGPSDAENQV